MTTSNPTASAATPDPTPTPAAPARALPHPTFTQQTATVVQVACLLLAVLTFLVAGVSVAGVLVQSVGPPEVLAVESAERPDYLKMSQQINVYQSRRQSQIDQRATSLASGGFLTGVAVALLSVSLLLGAVRIDHLVPPSPPPPPGGPKQGLLSTGAPEDKKEPPTPTPGQRLVALAPGVISLIGAIVIITASLPHTQTAQGQSPYGTPVSVGFPQPVFQQPVSAQ